MEERRSAERAGLSGWVELSVSGQRRRRAVGSDVSVDGLGVLHDGTALHTGARVMTEFPLPGIGLPLEIPAEVVWVGEERAGLRFAEMDPGLRELVESFVAGRLAE